MNGRAVRSSQSIITIIQANLVGEMGNLAFRPLMPGDLAVMDPGIQRKPDDDSGEVHVK
jgi:hypothetical protein